MRDSTLAASGLLYPAVGGHSVFPPQPESVLELKLDYDPVWEESRGKDSYKRGLYIQYQRTTPYPFLQNFDAPDASAPACRRGRSNTPLQALNLLNDPVFFEAAQFLALRILKKLPAASFHDRLDYGFPVVPGPAAVREGVGSDAVLSHPTESNTRKGTRIGNRAVARGNGRRGSNRSGGLGRPQPGAAESGRILDERVAMTFEDFLRIDTRRRFLRDCAGGLGMIALGNLLSEHGLTADSEAPRP